GLFAVNYAPDKPDEWMWYSIDHSKSWFHKPQSGVTDLLHKWAPEPGALALGAGALIATNSDNGYLFNGKFLLLLLFPGPVFMLDGRCNFLKTRAKQKDSEEPDFHALIVLDAKAGYFLIGLDARLDADIFKPFHILGTLSIVISTRFKDFKFDVRLEWGPQPVRPEIPGAYKDAGIGHLKSTVEWALLEGAAAPTVPVDCRPYITFENP